MKPKRLWMVIVLLAFSLLITGVAAAHNSGYVLDWFTIDGGGGVLNSAGSNTPAYQMSGTTGQPDAGSLSAGGYQLLGGFWTGSEPARHMLFLPSVRR